MYTVYNKWGRSSNRVEIW